MCQTSRLQRPAYGELRTQWSLRQTPSVLPVCGAAREKWSQLERSHSEPLKFRSVLVTSAASRGPSSGLLCRHIYTELGNPRPRSCYLTLASEVKTSHLSFAERLMKAEELYFYKPANDCSYKRHGQGPMSELPSCSACSGHLSVCSDIAHSNENSS